MEEDEEEEDKEANVEKVTLLYKLMPGACPSSYGFNAARLAGMPDALVLKAKQQAQKLQNHPKKIGLFAQLMGLKLKDGSSEDLPDVVKLLKKQLRVV
jgi:DNA mismatch repair ATPase MutS